MEEGEREWGLRCGGFRQHLSINDDNNNNKNNNNIEAAERTDTHRETANGKFRVTVVGHL